ncbi:Lipid A biosynthesis (KDO)2-(lauroyl)-lipid IVA acyltransferase [Raoultella planticola]|uniref:Lipid A biosynthesis (KDO)2-(Lauroyl)-lipid IVA acyltransferase n=1 Tax=Raoultella planticola TaxID=575 RepID=A0A485ACW1_RAOPL|nr:Lipid A biosynthesis (KDO)2-(lauroyl)-lipid IVA acyltransferase [Raoultella planticola]
MALNRLSSRSARGYWGYYLPDQDHGAEHSEFVDFFATYKATLPAIGRLMKVCRARVVRCFRSMMVKPIV